MRIEYGAGSEHAPDDPFGHTLLLLDDADGSVHLTNRNLGIERGWTARLTDPGEVAHIVELLREGGFPALPVLGGIVPGTTMRTLVVDTDGQRQELRIPFQGGENITGFAEAFELLDSVIVQVSGGELPVSRTEHDPLVTDAHPTAGQPSSE